MSDDDFKVHDPAVLTKERFLSMTRMNEELMFREFRADLGDSEFTDKDILSWTYEVTKQDLQMLIGLKGYADYKVRFTHDEFEAETRMVILGEDAQANADYVKEINSYIHPKGSFKFGLRIKGTVKEELKNKLFTLTSVIEESLNAEGEEIETPLSITANTTHQKLNYFAGMFLALTMAQVTGPSASVYLPEPYKTFVSKTSSEGQYRKKKDEEKRSGKKSGKLSKPPQP